MTELGLQTILEGTSIVPYFFAQNYYMKKDVSAIYQLINHKNKNCKKRTRANKNCSKVPNSVYYNLHTSNIYKQIKKVCASPVNLFPQWYISNSKQLLVNCGRYVNNKINSNVQMFRGVRGNSFVELVAKDCANSITNKFGLSADEYINARYGFCNFYKKELIMLPYLILQSLLEVVIKSAKYLKLCQHRVMLGAKALSVNNLVSWSEEKLYGFVKYNKNTLKISKISTNYINKCVFYFIQKLNKQEVILQNAVYNIEKLFNTYCRPTKHR